MARSTRRFILFLLYVVFVMGLTTSAVWACKYCYVVEDGEIVWKRECQCECKQGWRDSSGMQCIGKLGPDPDAPAEGCGHYVDVTGIWLDMLAKVPKDWPVEQPVESPEQKKAEEKKHGGMLEMPIDETPPEEVKI